MSPTPVVFPKYREFICTKLVNKFVSDEISLDTYKARTAPEWLLTLVDDAIAAWQSTVPQGNIATVMTAILDPVNQLSGFWLEGADRMRIPGVNRAAVDVAMIIAESR